jgi:hypothetical protein
VNRLFTPGRYRFVNAADDVFIRSKAGYHFDFFQLWRRVGKAHTYYTFRLLETCGQRGERQRSCVGCQDTSWLANVLLVLEDRKGIFETLNNCFDNQPCMCQLTQTLDGMQPK